MTQSQPNFQNYMPQVHLRDYLQIILRRRWIVITFFTVLVTTVIIGTLKQTPVYEGTTTLLIERKSPRVISVQEVSPMGTSDYHAYKDYYETQYKLIRSRAVLTKVADSVKINISNRETNPVDKLLKIVTVNPIKNSQLVKISAQHPHPAMAAEIANTVAEEYIRQNLERNINVADDASQWLSERIEDQRQKLRDAEKALQEYREDNNLTILPQVRGNEAVENITAEYARLQAQLANYSQRYTGEHPKMIELKAQIVSLRNKIQGLEDISAGDTTMEYRVLEREAQGNKRMYEILLTRLKEIDLSGSLDVNNISIIDRAQIPPKPIKPNVKLNIILAVMVGFIGGMGLAFFVDYLDTTIKSAEDIKETLGLCFLGAIPEIIEEKDGIKKDKTVYYQPHCVISESYRAVRTEVSKLMSDKADSKSILITSAEPQSGKTLTASNLAISFSQTANKVILVDCDLRKPQMDKIFNLDKEPGLTEYLLGKADIDSIIKYTEAENLTVITSGKIPRNPAEIIGYEKMKELINDLKNRFDFIFFDSPPVISVTDAVILADIVDGLIQVVRSGKALMSIAQTVKERLANTKANNLGVILNAMKAYHGDYSYYYRYYRYYGQDTGRRKAQEAGV